MTTFEKLLFYRVTMIRWLQRRREIERLAKADADVLVRDYGADAFWEARYRESAGIQLDVATHQIRTPAHWRRVALIVARRTGRAVQLDAATGMLSRVNKAS